MLFLDGLTGKGILFVLHFTLVFLPTLRCTIFHQYIIHGEGLVVMTQNLLAFLNLQLETVCFAIKTTHFHSFGPLFYSSFQCSNIFTHTSHINISTTNFCRTRCAPAIQTEHSLTNTCPGPRHFQAHCAQELSLTTRTVANSGYCLYFPIFNFDNLPISCPSKQNICKNNLCD